jgi:hypothetical protein
MRFDALPRKLESEPIIFQIFLKVIVPAAPFGLQRST